MACRPRSSCLATLLAALLVAIGPAIAASPVLPPINNPPSGQSLPGKFVWVDLVTPDVAAAKTFYRKMFGWSYRTLADDGRPYTLAYRGRQPVGGMIQRREESRSASGRWVAFMSVPDVAAAAKFVVEKGGKVLIEARSLPERGEMSLLADPDGVPIGVITSSSGDRDDFLVEHGEWIWALYQSPAAVGAAAFYQELAGYEVVPDDRYFEMPHFLLVSQGYARASLLEIPSGNQRLQPGWLYFIRVEDVAKQVERAQQLGGRVLVAPRSDLAQGRLAVIADPGGAPVGLLEWDAEVAEDRP